MRRDRVFISYRQEDAGPIAALAKIQLEDAFPGLVFFDVDNIRLGQSFADAIDPELKRAAVVVVLIGHGWVGDDGQGTRRIDDPDDWVRREVATALAARPDVQVMPVLVNGSAMPPRGQLPLDLAELSECRAAKADWKSIQNDLRPVIEHIGDWLQVGVHPESPRLIDPPRFPRALVPLGERRGPLNPTSFATLIMPRSPRWTIVTSPRPTGRLDEYVMRNEELFTSLLEGVSFCAPARGWTTMRDTDQVSKRAPSGSMLSGTVVTSTMQRLPEVASLLHGHVSEGLTCVVQLTGVPAESDAELESWLDDTHLSAEVSVFSADAESSDASMTPTERDVSTLRQRGVWAALQDPALMDRLSALSPASRDLVKRLAAGRADVDWMGLDHAAAALLSALRPPPLPDPVRHSAALQRIPVLDYLLAVPDEADLVRLMASSPANVRSRVGLFRGDELTREVPA